MARDEGLVCDPVTECHHGFYAGECGWCDDEEKMRAALTRALTAQAWAVACALFNYERHRGPRPLAACRAEHGRLRYALEDVAALPAPADLAEEMLR